MRAGGGRRGGGGGGFCAALAKDQRFELRWVREAEAGGSLVAFRLLAWLGADAEDLNNDLLDGVNLHGSGRRWLAPRREQIDGVRQLVLMQPLCGGADDARVLGGGGGGGGARDGAALRRRVLRRLRLPREFGGQGARVVVYVERRFKSTY